MRFTIAEIAARLDVEKETARGLVKYLEAFGAAMPMGARAPVNGRGRAEVVFEFREGFEKRLAKELEKAKLAD